MDGKSDDYIAGMFNAAVNAGDTKQRKEALAKQRQLSVSMDKDDKGDDKKDKKPLIEDAWKQDCSLSTKKR